jgi:hypothetical protein
VPKACRQEKARSLFWLKQLHKKVGQGIPGIITTIAGDIKVWDPLVHQDRATFFPLGNIGRMNQRDTVQWRGVQ